MADKTYKLTFKLSNGELKEVQFTVPEGEPGNTPYIGLNGNWYIGDEDTGVKAEGQDGKSAYQYAQDGGYTGTEEEFAQKLASEGSSAPADWNAAEGEPGHVLNRTHYTERVITDIVPTKVIQLSDGLYTEAGLWEFIVGESYVVTFQGEQYECVAFESTFMGMKTVSIGNEALYGGSNNTGEPFAAARIPDMEASGVIAPVEICTIGIVGVKDVVHPLDDKYINNEVKLTLYTGSCSKTWKEIVAALDAKKTLVAENRGWNSAFGTTVQSLRLTYCTYGATSGILVFQGFDGDVTGVQEKTTAIAQTGYVILALNGEIVSVEAFESYFDPAEGLRNPYALTINGTTYDGSKAVNITIEGGSGDSVPDYVRTEAERVANVVQSHQNASTLTITAGSDAHLPIPSHSQYQNINNGLIHAGQAMGLLKKQIYTDFSFYAGDMIWDVGETAETAMDSMRYVHEVLADGFSGVQFWCRGNHEDGYESGANLTEEQIFANVGKWNTGAVFNPEDRTGGYCYRDIDDYKVRVICINTGDGITNISAKQNAWLAEALNVPVDDGWGTILLSHCPPDWLNGSATESSLLMQTIKAASGIICCIHGHTHCYKIGTVTGTNIPRIAVPNICFARNNEYGSSGSVFGDTSTINKTANSANDTAFAVISIDRAKGTAYVDYYGARPEDSRTVSGLPTWKTTKIVNQVTISQQKNSSDVYNGTGYKNGAYPSDAGADGTDAATVVTGWIPYNKEVIYVKGATLDTTNSHVRWRSYHANKSDGMYSAGSTIGDYFAIETLGDNYYKLTPKNTITIYDYYRMSFVGTGENLIITHNEPIE